MERLWGWTVPLPVPLERRHGSFLWRWPEEYPQGPRNTPVLFDRHGVWKLVYAKVHTCDFGEERIMASEGNFYTTDMDTARGRFGWAL